MVCGPCVLPEEPRSDPAGAQGTALSCWVVSRLIASTGHPCREKSVGVLQELVLRNGPEVFCLFVKGVYGQRVTEKKMRNWKCTEVTSCFGSDV